MTRKEQIKEAAYKWAFHSTDSKINDCSECEYGFVNGAKWADANQNDSTLLHEYHKACAKLVIAVEALRKIEMPDTAPNKADLSDWLNAWRNTTKTIARQAIEKIEGDK